MRNRRLSSLLALIPALFLLFHAAPIKAATWNQLSPTLAGKLINDVAVSPGSKSELSAIAGGSLYSSIDGSLTWTQDTIPYPTYVAYDPAHPHRLYLGANNSCLRVRDDFYSPWKQVYLPDTQSCNIGRMVATSDGLYFINNDQNGTHGVYLYGANGAMTRLSFPNTQPYSLAADEDGNVVIGTSSDIYRTTNKGATWAHLADINVVGSDTEKVAVEGDAIWTISSNQYFFSPDKGVTWQAKGIKRTDSSYGFPLAFGDKLYFGYQNQNSGAADVATDNTGAPTSKLGLGQMAYSLARLGDSMLAGSYDGLYINRGSLPSKAAIRRPVVVIPGILGSWSKHIVQGDYVLDPLKGTYNQLLNKLRSVGYSEPNHTLYPFPYQWRQPDELTALYLKEFIAKIKIECSCAQVDLVAHSQGGLVAREYIEGPDYNNDVNKLITLGTPQNGSLNAYYTWEAGLFYQTEPGTKGRFENNVLSGILHIDSFLRGDTDFLDYVHRYAPSVGELLPDYSYIQGREYPNGYPRNLFLENLNLPTNIDKLLARVKLRVIASESKQTLTQLKLTEPTNKLKWPDGEPLVDTLGVGDGTVPVRSGAGLINPSSWVDSEHRKIPDNSQVEVVHYLLGDDPDPTYLATIPNQQTYQAIADSPEPDITSYRIIYAPSGHSLAITDNKGRTTSVAT
ncbi:MAG: hypothetical protein ABIS59_03975, partial [Candidatus Saccharibacteria bacterium]